MAIEKVILAEKKFSNNWWSIKDNLGREISIGTINKKTSAAENQKLNSILVNANAGDEIEIDVRDWQGKFYGNDPKGAGSGVGTKSFTPADKSFQSALSSAQAASTLLSLTKDVTFEKWNDMFEKIHAAVLSKKSD